MADVSPEVRDELVGVGITLQDKFKYCDTLTVRHGVTGENNEESVWYVELSGVIPPEAFNLFIKHHREYVECRAPAEGRPGRRFMLIYDLRTLRNPIDVQLEQMSQFTKIHAQLAPTHKKCLKCTLVGVSNDLVKNAVNALIKVLYTPVRPMQFFTSLQDEATRKFLTDVHSGKLKLEPPHQVEARPRA